MITLYSGISSLRESPHLIKLLEKKVKHGNTILSNFDISSILDPKGSFTYIEINQSLPYWLLSFANSYANNVKESEKRYVAYGEILLVLDESQLFLQSDQWNRKIFNDLLKFFIQHRKLGFDIILISKSDDLIDLQFRHLICYEIIHRKVSEFGVIGKYLGSLLHKDFFTFKVNYPFKDKNFFVRLERKRITV